MIILFITYLHSLVSTIKVDAVLASQTLFIFNNYNTMLAIIIYIWTFIVRHFDNFFAFSLYMFFIYYSCYFPFSNSTQFMIL